MVPHPEREEKAAAQKQQLILIIPTARVALKWKFNMILLRHNHGVLWMMHFTRRWEIVHYLMMKNDDTQEADDRLSTE